MNRPNDIRIETFRQTVERLTNLTGALQTLAITLHRANELPGLIASTTYPTDRQRFREELRYRVSHDAPNPPSSVGKRASAGSFSRQGSTAGGD
jgi:hypothetical protein